MPPPLDLNLRCWYWRGASGRHYIHSVYAPKACPPFLRAVYVAVRRRGDLRHAIAVGRFADFWQGGTLDERGADEIHVHLLARDPAQATAVVADIQSAMDGKPGARRRCSSLSALAPAGRAA